MTLVPILLALLAQEAQQPGSTPDLPAIQALASGAHEAFRERLNGPQRCDPQTLAAGSTANRLAIEAAHQRRLALTALEEAGKAAAEPVLPSPAADEAERAAVLLQKEMDMSQALLAGAFPGDEIPAPAMARPLAQAANLPQLKDLAEAAAQSPKDLALPAKLASDVAIEERLINAYFAAAKSEIERVCTEKSEPADDPFRVPARPAKPASKKKGGP